MSRPIDLKTIGVAGGDYSVIEAFADSLPIDPLLVTIGVLTERVVADGRFDAFVTRRDYELAGSNFVLVSEAGSPVAAYVARRWEVIAGDLWAGFQGLETEGWKLVESAIAFLRERFGAQQTPLDSEIQTLFAEVSRRLAAAVAANPRVLDQIEWRDLERMLAEVFNGIGFHVVLTPGSKDGGKDLVLTVTTRQGRRHYVVEAKHWRSGKKVGPGVVTDFIRVVVRESRDAGLLLATYGYSPAALEIVSKVEQRRVRLGSEDMIVSLCQQYLQRAGGLHIPLDQLPQVLFQTPIGDGQPFGQPDLAHKAGQGRLP